MRLRVCDMGTTHMQSIKNYYRLKINKITGTYDVSYLSEVKLLTKLVINPFLQAVIRT